MQKKKNEGKCKEKNKRKENQKKRNEKNWKRKKNKARKVENPRQAPWQKLEHKRERLNTRVYLNPELRKAWFPCLGYVGNFILKSSRKTIRLCPCDGSGHLCLFCIREFGCNHRSEDWLQYTTVPFRQGATFRCHSMHRGVIQTRGNFPLPFNTLRCYPDKGQLSVAIQNAAVSFQTRLP